MRNIIGSALNVILFGLTFGGILGCNHDIPDIGEESWVEFDFEDEICSGTENMPDSLNILVIGNSFGVDITQKLPDIFESNQISNINITRLFKGFSSVYDHLNGLITDNDIYEEFCYTKKNKWIVDRTSPLVKILTASKWDIIVVNDVGTGYLEKDGQLTKIREYVESIEIFLDYKPQFVWLETWAYSDGFKIKGFDRYGWSERLMFNTINNEVFNKIQPSNLFWKIVPCCVCFQNARNSGIDNSNLRLTRDGFHADLGFGRTMLSYLFFIKVLLPYTNLSLNTLNYIDWIDGTVECTPESKIIMENCIISAIMHPFSISRNN